MKFIKRFWWVGLLLMIFSLPTLANTVNYQTISAAAQKNTDLSRQALVMIFGDVVLNPFKPSQKTLIGSLFAILNGILATVAVAWFLTVTMKSLVKSGHEGQVFGPGRTMLHPIMTFFGFMMIVPTASGWSMAQLAMLWATSVMGIGSANLLTIQAVDMMTAGYSVVVQPTAPSTRSAARGIFEMNLCKYATNQELNALYVDGRARTALMQTQGSNGQYVTSNGSAVCGSAKIPESPVPSGWLPIFDNKVNTASIMTAQRQALDTMQTSLDRAASVFVTTYLSKRDKDTGTFQDAETQIQNAAAAYEQTVNLAINQINYKDTLKTQLSTQIKSFGWVSLGSWYHTFGTANSKTDAVANATPVVAGKSHLGETGTGDLYNQVFTAYRAQIQNSPYTPPLGTQMAKDDGAAATAADPEAVLVGILSKPMLNLTHKLATMNLGASSSFTNQVNPLIKMQEVGDYTLVAAELSVAAYSATWAIASAASNSPVGWASKIFFVDTGAVVKDVMGALAPLFFFIMFALLAIGFTLAVYIPAVPFITSMVGVFNWLVSVLVGCAAGPMWAATHLGAEEDKGSRSAYGYVFLIDMMLRPSLMVLGFFFASAAAIAGGTLLNLLFAPALANANADSLVGLVKMIGWLMVYARIATFGVTRLFGLQATLADYVISFLGGRDGANLMGGMADSVQNMFGAAGSGAGRAPGVRLNSSAKGGGGGGDGVR